MQHCLAIPEQTAADGRSKGIYERGSFHPCALHVSSDGLFWQFPIREYAEIDYSKKPVILERPQAIERIENELLEIIPLLKEKGEVPYGRITRAAAQMLLAKLYLNNQVYTGTAPDFTDGIGKWTDISWPMTFGNFTWLSMKAIATRRKQSYLLSII